MTVMLRDPLLSDFAAMEQRMNQLFSRVFGSVLGGNGGETRRWTPPVDIVETDEHVVVLVDLPGVPEDSVTIELEDDVLTITGDRTMPVTGEITRWERSSGRFVRTLTVAKGLDADQITAEYRDGVLLIRVPKPAERRPKKIALSGGAKELQQ